MLPYTMLCHDIGTEEAGSSVGGQFSGHVKGRGIRHGRIRFAVRDADGGVWGAIIAFIQDVQPSRLKCIIVTLDGRGISRTARVVQIRTGAVFMA